MKEVSFPRMHVSLYVSDITKTVTFYETFFGQAAEKVKEGYAKFHLAEPALIISFVENKEKVSANFGHLGIQVETEDELYQRLGKLKMTQVKVLEEMGTNCCYAHQDKFWVSDPDGTMWEVYYFHSDVEFNDPRYSGKESQPCDTTVKPEKKELQLAEVQANVCTPGSGCC